MSPHAKKFLKQLLALQKKLKWSNTELGEIIGKHRDTLKNWKAGKTAPSLDDIADVCKRLSLELAERNRAVGFIAAGSNEIRSFITEHVETTTTFASKKVSR